MKKAFLFSLFISLTLLLCACSYHSPEFEGYDEESYSAGQEEGYEEGYDRGYEEGMKYAIEVMIDYASNNEHYMNIDDIEEGINRYYDTWGNDPGDIRDMIIYGDFDTYSLKDLVGNLISECISY